VIIPAFNEEKVLRRTVESILKSRYQKIELIIVDDGSTDKTWEIAQELQHDSRVTSVRQQNGGKSSAVNHGIRLAEGEVLVNIDADTVFPPKTIGKLVRYFYYPEIGAVAGVVKVGNIKSWITRWQALEYITSINIERAAQAYLRSITVAPGACSAWRKEAVLKVGGFSSATFAEDCDIALAVQKAGYTIVQDMEAVAFTECPETLRGLAKQRFRWLFGNIQSFWKHRDMLFRRKYGWLGMYVIPKAILSIIMQLVFTPLLLFVLIGNLLAGVLYVMLLYVAIAYIVLFLTAAVALVFAHERFRHLTATPAFRLVYSPLRTIILYLSVIAALGGVEMGWNKVARTGTTMHID
jgi:biofilm PGA synthesis N-glycosyltransferase PgaC